jgi:hypothetical protein
MRSLAFAGLAAAGLSALASAQSTYITVVHSAESLNALMPAPALKARARIGADGLAGEPELALGSGAQPNASTAQMHWTSAQAQPFRLTYDGFGTATLVVGSQGLLFSTQGPFEALAVSAVAPGAGRIARAWDLELNGVKLPKGAFASTDTNGKSFDAVLIQGANLRNGFVLKGWLRLVWTGAPPVGNALRVDVRGGRLAEQVERFCPATPNSAGTTCKIGWWGTTSISSNKFKLDAREGLPNGICLFLVGATAQSLPFGNGTLCVGPPFDRLADFQSFDAQGRASLSVSFKSGPLASGPLAVEPGDSRTFQVWYRDPAAFPEPFNLSDALLATILP